MSPFISRKYKPIYSDKKNRRVAAWEWVWEVEGQQGDWGRTGRRGYKRA